MNTRIRDFLHEEDGITALEYGILAAVVASLLIAGFKTGIGEVFDDIVAALKGAVAKVAPATS